jgi:hypothetical protein
MSAFSQQIEERILDLLWSVWTALGVSGWERHHGDWYIDPEPLIVFTAWAAEADPRLRDESTDWCVRYGRYISAARLKHVLPGMPETMRQSFGEYAATVGAHAGVHWPSATKPRPFSPIGRSLVEAFSAPAQLALRLRATFGVGARAEVLRHLVTAPAVRAGLSAADFADALYTTRNVAEELESLRLAGILRLVGAGHRRVYVLQRTDHLLGLAAPLPHVFPSWIGLCTLLHDIFSFARGNAAGDPVVRAVGASRLLRQRQQELLQMELSLGVAPPPPTAAAGGEIAWVESFEQWALALVSQCARGRRAISLGNPGHTVRSAPEAEDVPPHV